MMINNLTGVVVCGGKSSRMGRDKSLLHYYGHSQRMQGYHLLRPYCEKVLLSLNTTQTPESPKLPFLVDDKKYNNIGPMAALLTAFEAFPDNNFLFIGCDYPLLNASSITAFVHSINENTEAKAFYNTQENLYEPLLAYYSAAFKNKLFDNYQGGNFSLQSILRQINAEKFLPEDDNVMKSVDDKGSFEKVMAIIKSLNTDV